MESVLGRYRNLVILVGVLFLQVLGLAVQVKRATENQSSRLIRVWAVNTVTPLERGIVWFQTSTSNLWHNYFYLRGVRQENRQLKEKIEQLEIERVRLSEDAEQAHRLQALLGFKEQFIARTIAAQVIGSSGSEQSRSIYIDKGARDGLQPDMAVITAEGVVGKVLRVQERVSNVLLINDQTSGVGAILEKSRLQGVLRGTPSGDVVLEKVMMDETVQSGEKVLTSGGDRIFPKGLPVGVVTMVSPSREVFLNIRVRPAANLSKLEEVLIVTQQEEKEPVAVDSGRMRAADILAQRLPSVPEKPATSPTVGPKPDNATPRQPVDAKSKVIPGQVSSPVKSQPGDAHAKPKPAMPADAATVKPVKENTAGATQRPAAAQPSTPHQSGDASAPPPTTPAKPAPPQDQPH